MTDAPQTPKERQKAIMDDWMENGCGDKPLAQKARVVANAMFATCHNEGLDDNQFRASLALLSGGAVATLLDCAKVLEERVRA